MANTKVTGDLLADGTLFARHLNESHGITTSVIGEGTNLFYTDTRVGTYLGTYLPANGYDTATNIIASIVDSAPVTLDTLNELAAALGDDPNFATTVTNSLAGKLPLTGGTLTGALSVNGIITSNSSSAGDYVRLYAGSGSAQWDIYGNGENLRFSENSSGGGSVVIDSNLSIGNTNNTYKLDVSGTGRFTGMLTISDTTEYLRSIQSGTLSQAQTWYAADGTTRRAVFGFRSGGSDNFTLLNERNGSLLIGTNDTTNLAISSTGTATFSSDVVIQNGKFLQAARTTGGALIDIIGIQGGNDTLQIKGGTSGAVNSINFYDTGGLIGTFYNGRLGIGATSPATKLDVQISNSGTGLGDGMILKLKNTSTTNGTRSGISFGNIDSVGGSLVMQSAILKNSTTGEYDMTWDLYGGSAGWKEALLYLDSNPGNVGIGTTTPDAKLHVSGYAVDNVGLVRFQNFHATGDIMYPALQVLNDRGNHSYGTVAEFRISNASDGDRPSVMFSKGGTGNNWSIGMGVYSGNQDNFAIGHRGSYYQDAWATPIIVATTGGLVGIGTTLPQGKLDVVGDISYIGSTNSSVFVVRNDGSFISGGGSSTSLIVQYGGQNIATLSNTGTGQRDAILSMRDEGVVKVKIAANNSRGGETFFNGGGDFLIGKDTTSVDTNGVFIQASSDYAIYSSVGSPVNTYHVYNTLNDRYDFYVSYNGTIYARNTTIQSLSDQRLKDNIQDLTGGLDTILALRPRTFDFKDGSKTNAKGFIAQEVEQVLPECVMEFTAGDPLEDGTRYKTVGQDFMPYVIKAIQELKAENDALKSRIKTLEQA